MLRLRNVAALQRSLNTKAFLHTGEPKEKDDSAVASPAASLQKGNKQLFTVLNKLKRLPNQKTVKGCKNLEDIHDIMEIYRSTRDSPERTEKVIASDVVNAILTTTRERDHVFRRSFIKDRTEMIQDQNATLTSYLEEIVNDIAEGRTCLSAYAVTYLLTAFSRMGKSNEIFGLWEQLKHIGESLPDLAVHLKTPTVVSAALNNADPATISLEYVEKTYENTIKESGSTLHLEEALIRAYLRANDSDRVAEKYAALLQEFPVSTNGYIFSRIHSRVLTETQDIKIATAFFEMAIRPDSHIDFVHPGAITSFIKLDYSENKDWNQSADIFLRSAAYYAQRHPDLPAQEIGNMMNAIWQIFATHYFEDTQDARKDCDHLLTQFLKLYPQDWIFFNNALTQINKYWLGSSFPEELVERAMGKLNELGADSCRVILNTRPSINFITRVWSHRESLKTPMILYDYTALIKSANTEEKAKFALAPLAKAAQTLPLGGQLQLRKHCLQNEFVKIAIQSSGNDILNKLMA